MKFKPVALLILLAILSFGFRYPENRKFIGVLKDNKGKVLGEVYISDFKNNVFKKLLITRENKGKKDTLYFINNCVWRNSKGIDLEFDKEHFAGYMIEHLKGDTIQLFGIGKGSAGASDPAVIAWNYKKKIFEIQYSP